MSGLAARLLPFKNRARSAASALDREAVPARVMAPRMLFVACSAGLLLFGLLMIYSSSSIVGLTSKAYGNDPSYFLVRQIAFSVAGLVFATALAVFDYRRWQGIALKVMWVLTLLSLVLVYTPIAGHDAYGATRWIAMGPFSLQPSEFAKVTVLLTAALIAQKRFEEESIDNVQALKLLVGGVAVPMALILFQPDKGTTGVLAVTLLVMAYLAGVPMRKVFLILLAGVGVAAVLALRDEYSRARVMTMFDPFSDEFGAGYQLVQGFYALGSGGVTGVGIGLSRQKYNYLPMAHNDFIFAVVGEELGFVGALLMILTFCALLWAGLKIAENAPDLMGRLIAAGCTSLIVIQLLLNVCGVIGIFPLSGKPVPFVSYGGSSIISTLMLVGLVLSVSFRSTLPQTRYEERRSKLRLAVDDTASDAFSAHVGGSTAGRAMPRSTRLAGTRQANATLASDRSESARSDLRIVDGGARSARLAGRTSVDSSGRRRIDLGPSAAERLRSTRRKK